MSGIDSIRVAQAIAASYLAREMGIEKVKPVSRVEPASDRKPEQDWKLPHRDAVTIGKLLAGSPVESAGELQLYDSKEKPYIIRPNNTGYLA